MKQSHDKMLDKYFEVVPHDILENAAFYFQPNTGFASGPTKPWHRNTLVGKNTLATMIEKMCDNVGISGDHINHSLRAYGTTTLRNSFNRELAIDH